MLEQPLLFTGCSSIQLFKSPPFSSTVSQNTFCTLLLTVQYLSDLQDAMPGHWSPSTSHPTIPRETEDFLGVASILRMWLCSHSSLFATSLMNNSGLIFKCVKIMNVFTCGEEISKLAV